MTKRCPGNPPRGFTLIELLVVIVIIGVIVGMAVLSVGGSNTQELLLREAERLQALIRLAGEESILQSRELAVTFQDTSYSFLTLTREGWKPVQDDTLLRTRRLPEGLRVEIESVEDIGALDTESEELVPHVLILSSGEITPFEVHFVDEFREAGQGLTGFITGKMEIQTLETPL